MEKKWRGEEEGEEEGKGWRVFHSCSLLFSPIQERELDTKTAVDHHTQEFLFHPCYCWIHLKKKVTETMVLAEGQRLSKV